VTDRPGIISHILLTLTEPNKETNIAGLEDAGMVGEPTFFAHQIFFE
jgi:hypothetical protein